MSDEPVTGRPLIAATPWRRQGTPAVDAAMAISLVAVPLGLVTGRPELVVLGSPLIVAVVASLAGASPPRVDVWLTSSADRVIEGQATDLIITILSADSGTVIVDYTVNDPSGVHHRRAGAAVQADVATEVVVTLDNERWGARDVECSGVTVDRVLGLVRHRQEVVGSIRQRVLPSSERLRRVLAPRRTRPALGNLPSRALGPGLEFAGTRPYRVGDDHRWINWRSSARHGELWVNEFHVERSADVVLFIDAFRDVTVGEEGDESSGTWAVRLADTIADAYLREQARVGAVSYGSSVRWLRLGMGRRQAFQIVDTLIDAEATLRTRRLRSAALPPRQIPREALVVVISPLLDHRILTAIAHLRSRHHEVAVIDLGGSFDLDSELGEHDLDDRLLSLARREAKARLAAMGVPVAQWASSQPLEPVLANLDRWRGRAVSRR